MADNIQKKRAWALLKRMTWLVAKKVPIVGGAFECAGELWEAYQEAGKEKHLSPEQVARLLMLLEPKEAEAAVGEVLETPEARQSTALLTPIQHRELRQLLVQLPSNFRLLPHAPENRADVEKVLQGERPRRFNQGDQTADRQYTLEAFLGFGGFGEVWTARDFAGERRAVKFCLDPEAVASLEAEFEVIRQLYERLDEESRAGFLRFFPCNLHCDTPYLVTELCEGGDLLERMESEREPLSPESYLELLAEPLQALARAHAEGIVHRDIKPANILIGADGRARLSDFGLARVVVEKKMATIVKASQDGRSSKARGAGVAGSALYMAPEVKRGEVGADDLDGLKRADVYSFGATLAQLLLRNPAMEGGELDREDLEDLPEPIALFLEKCLKGRPERRFADAGEMMAFLEREGALERAFKSKSIPTEKKKKSTGSRAGFQAAEAVCEELGEGTEQAKQAAKPAGWLGVVVIGGGGALLGVVLGAVLGAILCEALLSGLQGAGLYPALEKDFEKDFVTVFHFIGAIVGAVVGLWVGLRLGVWLGRAAGRCRWGMEPFGITRKPWQDAFLIASAILVSLGGLVFEISRHTTSRTQASVPATSRTIVTPSPSPSPDLNRWEPRLHPTPRLESHTRQMIRQSLEAYIRREIEPVLLSHDPSKLEEILPGPYAQSLAKELSAASRTYQHAVVTLGILSGYFWQDRAAVGLHLTLYGSTDSNPRSRRVLRESRTPIVLRAERAGAGDAWRVVSFEGEIPPKG